MVITDSTALGKYSPTRSPRARLQLGIGEARSARAHGGLVGRSLGGGGDHLLQEMSHGSSHSSGSDEIKSAAAPLRAGRVVATARAEAASADRLRQRMRAGPPTTVRLSATSVITTLLATTRTLLPTAARPM